MMRRGAVDANARRNALRDGTHAKAGPMTPRARARYGAAPSSRGPIGGVHRARDMSSCICARRPANFSRGWGPTRAPRGTPARAVSRAHYVEAGGRGALRPRCAQMRAQTYAACTEAIPRASQRKNLPTPFGPTPKVTPAKGHSYTLFAPACRRTSASGCL